MRKLAILIFQTLDGVMQSPGSPEEDPSGDFKNGGWAVDCWEDVMQQVMQEAMAEPYDLLLGRKTYNAFASYWPNASDDNPVATKLNKACKYVVTSDLDGLDWQNTVSIKGDIVAEITSLKEQVGKLLQVHGSFQLIQTLLAHDLIDEYRLWTFPVVVGSGKRLFADGAIPKNLRLKKSETCPSGAIMSIYETA